MNLTYAAGQIQSRFPGSTNHEIVLRQSPKKNKIQINITWKTNNADLPSHDHISFDVSIQKISNATYSFEKLIDSVIIEKQSRDRLKAEALGL